MQLIEPEKVLSLVGIGQSTGGVDAAIDALDATFSVIEQAVESSLRLGTTTDSFVVGTNRPPRLRLEHAFLTSTNITVTITGSPLGSYQVDTDRGLVVFSKKPFAETSIVVKYTHGFDSDAGGLLEEPPLELANAHLFMAAAALQLAPSSMPKGKATALKGIPYKGYELKARQILVGLSRPRATVDWPTFTSTRYAG